MKIKGNVPVKDRIKGFEDEMMEFEKEMMNNDTIFTIKEVMMKMGMDLATANYFVKNNLDKIETICQGHRGRGGEGKYKFCVKTS